MKTPPETKSVFRILVVGLLIGSSSLFAQTWDGGAALGASWASANNWNPNGVPALGANISFNNINNGKTTTTVVSSFSLGSITFQGAPNNAPVYTTNTNSLLNVGNTSLTLTGAGVINNSTNTQA